LGYGRKEEKRQDLEPGVMGGVGAGHHPQHTNSDANPVHNLGCSQCEQSKLRNANLRIPS